MSDALGSSDSPNVIGTISSDGIHDDSIEVCFCIREVRLFVCAQPASPQRSLQGNRIPLPRANTWAGEKKPARRGGAPFTKDPLRRVHDDKGKQRAWSPYPVPSACTPAPLPAPLPVVKTQPVVSETLPPPSGTINPAALLAPPASNPPPADPSAQAALSAIILALANPQQNPHLLSVLSAIDASSTATPNQDLVNLIGLMLSNAAASAPLLAAPSEPAPAPPAPAPQSAAAPAAPLTFLSAPTPPMSFWIHTPGDADEDGEGDGSDLPSDDMDVPLDSIPVASSDGEFDDTSAASGRLDPFGSPRPLARSTSHTPSAARPANGTWARRSTELLRPRPGSFRTRQLKCFV